LAQQINMEDYPIDEVDDSVDVDSAYEELTHLDDDCNTDEDDYEHTDCYL